jgi:hypothetical protein
MAANGAGAPRIGVAKSIGFVVVLQPAKSFSGKTTKRFGALWQARPADRYLAGSRMLGMPARRPMRIRRDPIVWDVARTGRIYVGRC